VIPRKKRSVLVPVVAGTVILAVAAGGLLHIMPLTPWIADAEKIASERFGEPVTVGTMRYSLFPSPALTLENVIFGRQQDVKIPNAIVALGIGSLFGTHKDIGTIELHGVTIDEDALPRVLTWTRPPVGEPRASVERISVRSARITLRDMEPISVSAEAQFDNTGGVTKATVKLSDGSLAADIVPKGTSAALTVRGSRFKSPVGPAYVFDDLDLTATVTTTQLSDIKAEGTVMGGKFKADGQARYGNGITVEGRFAVENINIEPLLGLFTSGVSITGAADLQGGFALRADSIPNLFAQDRVEFRFNGTRGTINNVDLVRAAQSATRDGVRGGRTRFNTISGSVSVAENRASFQQVRIDSDSLNAAGAFDVLPKGELSGRMNIQVGPKGRVVAAGSVGIAGDVRNPVLK
jgi:hypothetical protein